jgi:starch phosphorylase
VQLYSGPVDRQDDPGNNSTEVMNNTGKKQDGGTIYSYSGSLKCKESGLHGYTIRILPKHNLLINAFELGRVFWAN